MHQVPQNRSLPEQCFYITTNLNRNLRLFEDTASAKIILDSLQYLRRQGEIDLYGFVIMPNHVHIVLKLLGDATLPAIMRRFKSHTAHVLNQGEIWQHGYWSELVPDRSILVQKLSYIHQNPIRAGIVDRESDYPWSSAREFEQENSETIDCI